jgi:hypothetical protein
MKDNENSLAIAEKALNHTWKFDKKTREKFKNPAEETLYNN